MATVTTVQVSIGKALDLRRGYNAPMEEAYIFINVRAGWARKIIRDMAEIPQVKSVNACWGRPDVIAHVEVRDEDELREVVISRIQNLEGVADTDTHIVVKM